MILKNRVRDVKTNKIIGYERINKQGHWEHLRKKRQAWLLGCITSEDNLLREPFIQLLTINYEEIYLNDKIKAYYDDKYGWRVGHIIWDNTFLCFAWDCWVNELNIRIMLGGSDNVARLKFEL